ncbi:septum formation family protein [Amycolatopsis suaedae]|uniref:Septum formation-related domain-containing protein n=1 Tax=Amycolatopsis suaedae TaxID=2510978 RepID=A0A4Q7J7Q5_9PSEU|nr:septum formation family protein [Amycolatopsis suaedae]RZQ62084.1 hypothetical protein EWH70_21090 [Amycolatopsis suaedae]
MSDEGERFHTGARKLRTWLLMAGAMFGAVLALSLSMLFSWGPAEVAGGTGGGAADTAARREAFRSPPGSCLTWDRPDAGDAKLIGCEAPHRFEVIGLVNVADRFPPDVPSPDLSQWRQIAEERCTKMAGDYLHKPLDPFGKLSVGVLYPSAEEWDDGDRELRCGLQWAAPGGQLQLITGPASAQEQSNIWKVGTCLALAGKTVGDPIECTKPHAYEIVGELDLTSKFPDEFPEPDEQKTWLDTECNRLVEDYTGGLDLGAEKLILTWDTREKASWEAGSTKVNCKVGAKLEDGSGLAPVTGSIHKDAKSEAPPGQAPMHGEHPAPPPAQGPPPSQPGE